MRLFYNKPFSTIGDSTWKKIKDRLDSSSIQTLDIAKITANLIEQNRIQLPVLGEEKEIKSFLNLEDNDGKIYEPNPFGSYANNVAAVATFYIPFSGNSGFFDIRPIEFVEVGLPAKVTPGNLIIKIPTRYVHLDLTDQWSEFVKRSITSVKQNIQTNLDNLQDDVNNFERSLIQHIESYIQSKRAELQKTESRNKSINPFN